MVLPFVCFFFHKGQCSWDLRQAGGVYDPPMLWSSFEAFSRGACTVWSLFRPSTAGKTRALITPLYPTDSLSLSVVMHFLPSRWNISTCPSHVHCRLAFAVVQTSEAWALYSKQFYCTPAAAQPPLPVINRNKREAKETSRSSILSFQTLLLQCRVILWTCHRRRTLGQNFQFTVFLFWPEFTVSSMVRNCCQFF
jgi:hypothetical protein